MKAVSHFQKLIIDRASSDSIAIISEEQTLSYRALLQKACGLAKFFEKKGLRKGDRIAVQLPNSVEFLLCYFAGIMGAYTIVPVNQSLPSADIEYILALTQPKLFIQSKEAVGFEDWDDNFFFESDENSLIAIFFTSGTTSRPKGVGHTTENMFANALAFNELSDIDETIRMLHVMPMSYMAGFLNTVLCPILAGGCVIVGPQFSAITAMYFWEPAKKYEANAMWISPTMGALLVRLNRNSEDATWTKQNLARVFVGTAPLPKATKKLFEQTFGAECLESYGMSEVMLVSGNTPKFSMIDGAVGRIINGIEIQVRDSENNNILPVGREGNLFIKTPFALKGYLGEDGFTIKSPLEEGWFSTGDYGYIDAENNLFITGRSKDLIIRGGANVSPRAIEEVLLHHPDIQDTAVIGRPHPFWGEEVVAFLIMKENKAFDKVIIEQYCKEKLSADATPALFEIVKEFPTSSTGKIQKNKLKELL